MAVDHFNWLYLVYLLVCSLLSILFLFYFNRLFASLVSYALRTYVWRQYHVYINVQALQLSLLGGRCFFKGFRYHGHNETILINDGYITWRYWLRRVRTTEVLDGASSTHQQEGGEEGQNRSTQSFRDRPATTLPCRIKLQIRGAEWYICNRTPAYDAIEKNIQEHGKEGGPTKSFQATEKDMAGSESSKERFLDSSKAEGVWNEKSAENTANPSSSESDYGEACARVKSKQASAGKQRSLPAFLSLLPIKIECSKVAIVIGNRDVPSVLTLKADAAVGQVDARRARSTDLYKQTFEFDFMHPVVKLRPNHSWKRSKDATTGVKSSHEEIRSPSRGDHRDFHPNKRGKMSAAAATAHETIHKFNTFFHSLFWPVSSRNRQGGIDPSQTAGEDRWIGLTRYLDDDDNVVLEQERWRSVEYGEHPTIVDSPKIAMNLYWDVPGLVVESSAGKDTYEDDSDINGDAPPDWAVVLRIYGGQVSYGPWADRLRQDLQPMFFPNAYEVVTPAEQLLPGQSRISTFFRLSIDVEEATTLLIPTRESSKDWKWKEELATKRKVHTEKKPGKNYRRKKKYGGVDPIPSIRPYGWLDVELEADSTITFTIDMVARQSGFRNSLELDVKSPRVSSSVNHGLLLSAQHALISCDLSNPLGWNDTRQWTIAINANSLELFLLRDHVFLLTDIMDDWSTGPPADYHTFVPFTYKMNFCFTTCNIHLNANDSNVINSPASIEENTFVTIWADNLVASVYDPQTSLQLLRTQISFDIDAQNGGFKFSRPPWNTQNVFVKSSEVATMEDLKIDGSYDYYTSTSPSLTDVLYMKVHGISPKIDLHGFLVRAFMRIKDNYFGENIHFRTLEEYQEQISKQSSSLPSVDDPPQSKIANDLDVILSITAVTAEASLPSYLYSSAENILLDIPSLGLELRFTNYYMDLVIAFSPVTVSYVSLSSPDGQASIKPSETQIFIDGVEIKSHRLFGLPPAEPTYVCNWDFDVGLISGECSLCFIRLLSSALQCFSFTFDDAENALQPLSLAEIHDVTYLRAHLEGLRIWVTTDDTALLLAIQHCNLEYNDLAKLTFSERLHMDLPSFVMALVAICDVSIDQESPGIQLRPYAFVEAALELSMLHRRYNFDQVRKSQQHHLTLHDCRTNRTPWLLSPDDTFQTPGSHYHPKLAAPAMPFPSMPGPLLNQDFSTVRTGSTSTSISAIANRSKVNDSKSKRSPRGKPLFTDPNARARRKTSLNASSSIPYSSPAPASQTPNYACVHHSSVHSAEKEVPVTKTHRIRGDSAYFQPGTSSSYKVPYSRFQNTSLDLSEVPPLPSTQGHPLNYSTPQHNFSDTNSENFPIDQQQNQRTSFFVNLSQGLRGFLKPKSLKLVLSIVEGLQAQEPESLLDQLQINALERLPDKREKVDHHGTVAEAQIRLPVARLRIFEEAQGSSFAPTRNIFCDLSIEQSMVTARHLDKISADKETKGSEALSAYIIMNHADLSVKVFDHRNQQVDAALQIHLRDTRLWGCKESGIDTHARFEDFEAHIAMTKAESIPLLVHSVESLSKDIRILQNIATRQATRLRQLVLSLTVDGQETPDPPFLTRASYVLRIANSHLRASESWRMVSRLRYIYRLLPAESQANIRSSCFNTSKGCPGNAREVITAIFRRMGTWNGDGVIESVLLDEIFGKKVDKSPRDTFSSKLKTVVKAEHVRLLLQPGKSQSQLYWESMSFELILRPPSSLAGVRSNVEAHAAAQLYFSKTTLTLNFEILNLFQHIVVAVPKQSKEVASYSPSPEADADTFTASGYRLHFVLMSEENTIALDSPSLRVLYLCRALSSTAVAEKTKDQNKMSTNFLIYADTANMEVLSHQLIVSVGKVDRPSVFGNLDGEEDGVTPHSWHLATSCTDISLKVLQDPLSLLTIIERVILNEVAFITRIMSHEKFTARKGQPEQAAPANVIMGRPHVALFLDSYLISYKVLPALSYRVTGKVGRVSVRPGTRGMSDVVLDFDLKEHSHAFLGRAGAEFEMISELVIPPINSHVVISTDPLQKDISVQGTIEHISLDAAAVHALLATLSYPEITELGSSVRRESSRLTQHYWPSTVPKNVTSTSPRVSQPFLFDASITLVGLGIYADTAQDSKKGGISQMHFELGHVHIRGSNRAASGKEPLKFPGLFVNLRGLQMGFTRSINGQEHPCGQLTLGATLQATSQLNVRQELIRAYQVQSSQCETTIYTETAFVLIDILDDLRKSFRDIDMTNEVKGLQKLRRVTLADLDIGASSQPAKADEAQSTALFSAMYSLELKNPRIIWRIGNSVPLSPGREAEDLVLSSTKIHLATRRDDAARLLIQDLQLQMVPTSQVPTNRSLNSALLPEVVFNVAYMSTQNDRRLAFQAAGKSLDLRLTSQFIIPASNIRRSIATTVNDVRLIAQARVGSPVESATQAPKWLKHKKLTSLLIDADFAGAVVHVQGRAISDPESRATDLFQGRRVPQQGRYGQFAQDHAGTNSTLRAPGVAIKVEYKNHDVENKSFNAEVKVDASSNVLHPSIVPLVLEISSSVKEVVGDENSEAQTTALRPSAIKHRPSASKLMGDERLKTGDPSVIFGNCTLNLGLRICRQDFTMSCQPVARVAATAQIDDIYVTANTVQSKDHEQSFTLSGSFSGLQASIQHAYSRDSTASLEVQAVVVSLMNSKHLGTANGISAITQTSPMKIFVNAKQSQDFLLFREIWLPADIRKPTSASAPSASSEPQAYIVQRYQQIASAGAFPWDATLSVAKLDFQVDLGQSLGKSAFSMSGVWVSSKKSSDWEQNLCLGMETVSLDSTGRMSGFVTARGIEVRTTIRWPVTDQIMHQAPLIQASISFKSIRVKAAFEYQAFAVANMGSFQFLMYNIRDSRTGNSDRLLGVVDVGTLSAFCTTTSASQALALYQAFERLIQEKQTAYEASLKESEKFLRRRSTIQPLSTAGRANKDIEQSAKGSLRLQTKVMVSLKVMNVGVFPSTFFDAQVFKIDALDASAQFAVTVEKGKLQSVLSLALGQLQVALSGVTKQEVRKSVGEVLPEDIIKPASHSRGGTILKVPRVVAMMRTWQSPGSTDIQYIFRSAFQGKVDVGWNYSRIHFLRGMWNSHVRALAARLGKPLPQSALQISTALESEEKGSGMGAAEGREKITAVVNVPQSKYQYTPLEPPVIETPQLRDMGEATPPLEWIGLQRERLPNLTHQIVIVSLLELAREVDDAYSRILGSS